MKSFVQMHKFWLRLGLTIAAAAILISSPAIFTGKAGATKQREVGSADALQRRGGGTGAGQTTGKSTAVLRNYDIRITGQQALTELLKDRTAGLSKGFAIASRIENNVSALRAQKPDLEVKMSDLTGSPDMIESRSGALTDPAPGRGGVEVVRDYLKANAGLYGIDAREVDNMRFIGESASPSGLRMVRYEQIVNGIPVFQSETRAILTADGRMVRTLGLLVGGTESADPLTNLTTPAEALTSAMRSVGMTAETSAMSVTNANREGTLAAVSANHPGINDEVGSKLVYFAIAPGVLIPAWSQVFFTAGDFDWYTITDAQTGTVLWRKNIRADASTHEARFRVYVQADGKTPADSPAPHSPTTNTVGLGTQYAEIFPTIVNMSTAQSIVASPNGWINDCPGGGCTLLETQTIGNNVHAYLDRQGGANANLPDTNAANVIDGGGKPTGNPDANARNRDFLGTTPRDFQTNFLPPPQGGAANAEVGQTAGTTSATFNGNNGTNNFDIFRRGVITQLFYITNWYHDQLYNLGFNEAAGNFQTTNFSGMGLGNDRVLAEAQDSGSTNNANFSTPPDGSSGRMQMYVFTGPTIDRDGSLDAEIVMHELTHGTSNRLIGNGSGLNWDIGAGMGEGWSDFYALSLLNNTNADNPNGLYASGAYATYKLAGLSYFDNYVYGIRRFPYTTDNSINPMTWADVDQTTNNLSGGIAPDPIGFNFNGGAEVHNSGEIWCLTLWEVRSRVIADPAGANNDVPTGNHTMLQLITDALKMTPVSPSFLDARDAIIAADGATNAYANEESIWGGFADRGLGYNAAEPIAKLITNVSPEIGIVESFNVPYLDKTTPTFSDVSGGNGNGSIDPGEQISISVPLKNPWHKATKGVASANATLSTSTAGVTIVGSGATYGAIAPQATTNGTSFIARIGSGVTCGQLLNFSVTTNSSLGPSTFTFSFRVGTASGTGAPVTYTKVESPGLAILDNQPTGKISTLNIPTDDYQIADVNVRIDSLTHTFPGDVVAGLKGPTGYGTTVLAYLGFAVGAGDGNNITNMVFDDSATGDTWLASNAQAPYTGSWKPYVNAPTASLVGLGPADPVGQLSRFNGTSPKGDWKLVVSDQFQLDAGTFNGWSLIITPVTFTCTPFVCPAPTVTCPGNITKSNDPNQCSAVVTYPAPTVTSNCSTPGTVTCTPPSGSSFNVGTTTVNCSSTDDQGHTGSCSFTVTVNDTQPPVITCPANKTAVTPTTSSTCATVAYTTTASDNCPGVTVVCNPPSGTCFPVGTTTVTCTATDASGNTATCSFTVTVFNVCLQDDSNPATVFLGNSINGTYRFCCGGTTYIGTAIVVKQGNNITFNQNGPDRKVTATIDGGAFRGSGSLQFPIGQTKCSITDRDTRNNGCVCP